MPTRLFRRYSNRLATLNLLFLCVLLGTWIPVQIYPVIASWPVLEPQIHYGFPHYARQSPLMNRVIFRLNGDDHAEYMLWMNPENREHFLEWFSPSNPMEVWALPISPTTWFVTDVQALDGGIDPYAMYPFQIGVTLGGILLTLVFWLMFLYFLREYWKYFRHRRWLSQGALAVPVEIPPDPAAPRM